MSQQSSWAQLNSFSYIKAGYYKNFSGLAHKIYSKVLQRVRPVTSITNIFLKTSEGKLFHERLKDIFLVAYLFMFSGISRTATHFNKLYILKLPCEKNSS